MPKKKKKNDFELDVAIAMKPIYLYEYLEGHRLSAAGRKLLARGKWWDRVEDIVFDFTLVYSTMNMVFALFVAALVLSEVIPKDHFICEVMRFSGILIWFVILSAIIVRRIRNHYFHYECTLGEIEWGLVDSSTMLLDHAIEAYSPLMQRFLASERPRAYKQYLKILWPNRRIRNLILGSGLAYFKMKEHTMMQPLTDKEWADLQADKERMKERIKNGKKEA